MYVYDTEVFYCSKSSSRKTCKGVSLGVCVSTEKQVHVLQRVVLVHPSLKPLLASKQYSIKVSISLVVCDCFFCRFSNLGNTCYMNAILQSLFSLPSFSNDMLRQSIPWKKVPINALLRYFCGFLFVWAQDLQMSLRSHVSQHFPALFSRPADVLLTSWPRRMLAALRRRRIFWGKWRAPFPPQLNASLETCRM